MVSLPLWSRPLSSTTRNGVWGGATRARASAPAIRVVNEDRERFSRDPIQGHWLPRPKGSTPVDVVNETVLLLAEVVKASKTRGGDALDSWCRKVFAPHP
jgi:hypothetical protein